MSFETSYLKPNHEGKYWAQQSQRFLGLWTPFGVVDPYLFSIANTGDIYVTYLMASGAKFTKSQQKKLKYIKQRGVVVDIMLREDIN